MIKVNLFGEKIVDGIPSNYLLPPFDYFGKAVEGAIAGIMASEYYGGNERYAPDDLPPEYASKPAAKLNGIWYPTKL